MTTGHEKSSADALTRSRDSTPSPRFAPRRWALVGYSLALAFAIVTSLFLLNIPVQLSDSFTEFLAVKDGSLGSVEWRNLATGSYFRPFRRLLIKVVYDLSAGHYYVAFRGFHAIELVVLILLVVRLLRVSTRVEAAMVPLCLSCLVGMHTFTATVVESYPVNHFLTILICIAAAVNLSQGRHRRINDVGAVALLVFAMLTLESGLLLWVVVTAGYLIGYRGVSRSAVVVMGLCTIGYFVLRFVVLDGTAPGIGERSSGYGFSAYDPPDLQLLFGAHPWRFYLYNAASAVSCVLFGEPRSGIWFFTRGVLRGGLAPWQFINVVTGLGTTLLLGIYVTRRAHAWRRLRFDGDDRLVLLFLVLLPANALFSVSYAKDVIMSPAGMFFALATCVAVRRLLFEPGTQARRPLSRALILGLAVLMAVGWSVRFVGLHYHLRVTSDKVRNEWAYYDDWEKDQGAVPLTPDEEGIRNTLLDDAILHVPRPPSLRLHWPDKVFDTSQ
jgi:hypothetical protein